MPLGRTRTPLKPLGSHQPTSVFSECPEDPSPHTPGHALRGRGLGSSKVTNGQGEPCAAHSGHLLLLHVPGLESHSTRGSSPSPAGPLTCHTGRVLGPAEGKGLRRHSAPPLAGSLRDSGAVPACPSPPRQHDVRELVSSTRTCFKPDLPDEWLGHMDPRPPWLWAHPVPSSSPALLPHVHTAAAHGPPAATTVRGLLFQSLFPKRLMAWAELGAEELGAGLA